MKLVLSCCFVLCFIWLTECINKNRNKACYEAKICIHSNNGKCGVNSTGDYRRFLDTCDILEYNCLKGTDFVKTTIDHCDQLPPLTESNKASDQIDTDAQNPETLDANLSKKQEENEDSDQSKQGNERLDAPDQSKQAAENQTQDLSGQSKQVEGNETQDLSGQSKQVVENETQDLSGQSKQVEGNETLDLTDQSKQAAENQTQDISGQSKQVEGNETQDLPGQSKQVAEHGTETDKDIKKDVDKDTHAGSGHKRKLTKTANKFRTKKRKNIKSNV